MKLFEYLDYNKDALKITRIDYAREENEEIQIMEKFCKKILKESTFDDYFKDEKKIYDNIEQYIKLSKIDFTDKKILEFGSGICKMSALISKHYKVKSIDCMDLSETLLTELAPRVISYIGGDLKVFNFIIGDMNKIDSIKEKYDVIICYSVVHHLNLPEYFFHEQLDKITYKNAKVLCLEEAAIPLISFPFSNVSSYKKKMYDLKCTGVNENVYTVFKYKTFFQKKWEVKNLSLPTIKNFIKKFFKYFALKGFSYNFLLIKK